MPAFCPVALPPGYVPSSLHPALLCCRAWSQLAKHGDWHLPSCHSCPPVCVSSDSQLGTALSGGPAPLASQSPSRMSTGASLCCQWTLAPHHCLCVCVCVQQVLTCPSSCVKCVRLQRSGGCRCGLCSLQAGRAGGHVSARMTCSPCGMYCASRPAVQCSAECGCIDQLHMSGCRSHEPTVSGPSLDV